MKCYLLYCIQGRTGHTDIEINKRNTYAPAEEHRRGWNRGYAPAQKRHPADEPAHRRPVWARGRDRR